MTKQSKVQSGCNPERKNVILHRWLEVLGYGTSAGLLVLLLVWFFREMIADAASIPRWVSIVSILVILIWTIFHIWDTKGLRWQRYLGIRHFWAYPPTWVGSIAGLGFVFIGIGWGDHHNHSFILWLNCTVFGIACVAIVMGLGVTAFLLCRKDLDRHTSKNGKRKGKQNSSLRESQALSLTDLNSFNDLVTWVKHDSPVKSYREDQLKFGPIVQRVARRLQETPLPSQAIVGPLGSGKSTLGRLLKEELEENGASSSLQIRLVLVELWPFETPKAVVEGILKKLLDAMREDVEVLGLRSIPTQYTEAMSAVGGWWKALAQLLQGSPGSPVDTLKRIDQVAIAIGIRYVLWVEDLERFAATSSKGDTHQDARERERLQPIEAVLHALNDQRSLTVITATTHLSSYFDLEKIARHLVDIPKIKYEDAARILHVFRRGCLDRWSDVKDPACGKVRKELDRLNNHMENYRLFVISDDMPLPVDDAVLVLCRTPRTLKQALRRCYDFWNTYPCEIDFDDLLLMNLLREGLPSAFAYVRDHIEELRNIPANTVPFFVTEPGKTLQNDLVKLAESDVLLRDKGTRDAVSGIVGFIFGDRARYKKPQGFATDRGDYWRLFLEERDLNQGEKDVPLLQAIRDADAEDSEGKALLAFLETSNCPDGLAVFMAATLPFKRMTDLLVLLVNIHKGESPSEWPEHVKGMPRVPPGLVRLQKCWKERWEYDSERWDAQMAQDAMLQAIILAVPENLTLAYYLEHLFFSETSSFFSYRVRMREFLGGSLKEAFENQPETLSLRLMTTDFRILPYLCWEGGSSQATPDPPFEGWTEFARTLLNAAGDPRYCSVVLPHLARLVARAKDSPNNQFTFIPSLADVLFGSSEAVLELVRNHVTDECVKDAAVQALIEAEHNK